MSRRYRPLDWDNGPVDLHEELDERCVAKLAACTAIEWDDLTRLAQDRIERQCMNEMEAESRSSFDEAQISAYEDARDYEDALS